MTRHKASKSSTTYYEPGSFVTIVCTASSHEDWGIRTFTRTGSGWIPSSDVQLLGGTDWTANTAPGPQLHERGNDETAGVQRLSADHVVLPALNPEDYDPTDPAHQALVEQHFAPGVYDRLTLRCARCGDSLPVTWPKLTRALDMLTAALPDRSFYRLTELRRAVRAASRP